MDRDGKKPPSLLSDCVREGQKLTAEEDSGGDRTLLRCDNTPSFAPEIWGGHFEFGRFSLYLGRRKELERQSRIQNIRRGHTVMVLDDYTDEVLQRELCSLYGEMDLGSQYYAKIFTAYKEERLEEVSSWIADEMLIKFLWEQEVDLINPDFEVEEQDEMDMSEVFSNQEIMSFEQIGNPNRVVERFLLPRTQSQSIDPEKEGRKVSDSCSKSLASYEPQIHYRFGCHNKGDRDKITKGSEIVVELQSKVSQHVTGISVLELARAFQNERGDDPNSYYDFRELMTHLPHTVGAEDVEEINSVLLYPTFVESYVSSPSQLFRSFAHRFGIILQISDGSIELTDAVGMFEKLFGFKLSSSRLRAWGFQSLEDFFTTLFTQFWSRRQNIQVVRASELSASNKIYSSTRESNSEKQFLRFNDYSGFGSSLGSRPEQEGNCKPYVAFNEKKTILTHIATFPLPKEVPDDCVRFGEALDNEFDKVSLRQTRLCRLVYFNSPANFDLVLSQRWKSLHMLQKEFTKRYCEWEADPQERAKIAVNPALLRKGLYLAVRCDYELEPLEYFRAEYVEKLSNRKHMVRHVDYGDTIEAEERNLYFLRRTYAYQLPMQAISCGLFNVAAPKTDNTSGEYWSAEACDVCYQLMNPDAAKPNAAKYLTVTFQAIPDSTGERQKYLVKVCDPDKKDVGVELMRLFMRR